MMILSPAQRNYIKTGKTVDGETPNDGYNRRMRSTIQGRAFEAIDDIAFLIDSGLYPKVKQYLLSSMNLQSKPSVEPTPKPNPTKLDLTGWVPAASGLQDIQNHYRSDKDSLEFDEPVVDEDEDEGSSTSETH